MNSKEERTVREAIQSLGETKRSLRSLLEARTPPDETDPPTGRFPRDEPIVSGLYAPRNRREPVQLINFHQGDAEWQLRNGRRFKRLEARISGVLMKCWMEQAEGISATRITFAAVNDRQGVGVAYFRELKFEVNTTPVVGVSGKHCILPRGGLVFRRFAGVDADLLRDWTYAPTMPHPDMIQEARADTAKRASLPFRDQNGYAVDLGPYQFAWSFSNLDDSHGGQGVGPYGGGADDWATFPAGYANREQEMLMEAQRPLWLEPDGLERPYWMGRTREHRLVGWNEVPDNWCYYGKRLDDYRAADHTHLWRAYRAAAALAHLDIFAEDWLLVVWKDFKLAHHLDRPVVQGNSLLHPLWKRIEDADGPSGAGDRGLAHKLRLLRECGPYIHVSDIVDYTAALTNWVENLSDEYGITYSRTDGGQTWLPPVQKPWVYGFHALLNLFEFQFIPALDEHTDSARAFLAGVPPKAFELRDGGPRDTAYDRVHVKPNDLPMYATMVHGVWFDGMTAEKFLSDMKGRGMNGASQDLDNVPRDLWEEGL